MRTDKTPSHPMPRRGQVQLNLLFLVACGVILAVLVTKLQQQFLPAGLSTQIGHNSEVWALALALGAGIFLLERAAATGTPPIPALALALACLGLAAAVYWLGAPVTVKTLNEPLLAAGLLIGYLALPRPLPPMVPWMITGLLALLVVLWSQVTLVFLQAESVTALLVAPVAFDVVERSVGGQGRRSARWLTGWLSFLVLVPALALASGDFRTQGGFSSEIVDYLARGAEGFWGIALLQMYLAFRRASVAGRTRPSGRSPQVWSKMRSQPLSGASGDAG